MLVVTLAPSPGVGTYVRPTATTSRLWKPAGTTYSYGPPGVVKVMVPAASAGDAAPRTATGAPSAVAAASTTARCTRRRRGAASIPVDPCVDSSPEAVCLSCRCLPRTPYGI